MVPNPIDHVVVELGSRGLLKVLEGPGTFPAEGFKGHDSFIFVDERLPILVGLVNSGLHCCGVLIAKG